MVFKILKHKANKGVYGEIDVFSMCVRDAVTPILYNSTTHSELIEYFPNYTSSKLFDLVEVEIREVGENPSYKIQTVSYGETTILVDNLPVGSKVIIENNKATVIKRWIPVTESLPGMGKLVEVMAEDSVRFRARINYLTFTLSWVKENDAKEIIECNQLWREIQEGE